MEPEGVSAEVEARRKSVLGLERVVTLVVVVRAEDVAVERSEVEAFSGLLACEAAREARQRPCGE